MPYLAVGALVEMSSEGAFTSSLKMAPLSLEKYDEFGGQNKNMLTPWQKFQLDGQSEHLLYSPHQFGQIAAC